jgi:putative hydrolase of the HAD superfamily
LIIDIHAVVDRSSPSALTPQEIVLLSHRKGLDGVVLTGRNTAITADELDSIRRECSIPGFLIMRGQEIECPEGRLLVIGCDAVLSDRPNYIETQRYVHEHDGCVILVHPFSWKSPFEGFEENDVALFSSFDGVEIYNSTLTPGNMRRGLEVYWRSNCAALGGSEARKAEDVGLFATKFLIPIASEQDIVFAVRKRLMRPCVLGGVDADPRGGSRKNLVFRIGHAQMANCRGLLFDLYGTLVNLQSFEAMDEFYKMARWLQLEGIGVTGHELYEFYQRRAHELYQRAIGRISFPEVDILRVFRDAIHHFSGGDRGEEFARKSALIFRALTIQNIELYPHTRKVLRELKRRGYRMGIVSNAQAAFTVPEIEDLRLGEFFDFIILSSDVGCSKPEVRIYQLAVRQLEIAPKEVAMIGDDLHGDIYAARGAGLKTVFVNSNVGTAPYPVDPDVTLRDGDLRNLLRVFP